MKTYFFEVDETNQPLLAKSFSKKLFFSTRLQDTDMHLFEDAEIISVFVHSTLTKEILNQMPNLKMIALRSTGYDNVDLQYCQENNIFVANVPVYGEQTVAEFVFGLLLYSTRKLSHMQNNASANDYLGVDLFGKTIGIIGTGRIGLNVAKIARGFSLNVLGYDLFPNEDIANEIGFSYVTLHELLAKSDIISLHVPYNTKTHHMMSNQEFHFMKDGVIFINTARGSLVDNSALLGALNSGKVSTALLDVIEGDSLEIRHHDHVVWTPHVAYNTAEAANRIILTTLENISAFEKGILQNVVKT